MILPIFMFMLFLVLELGNIAYHTIIAHHAAYEMARVGGMVGVTRPGAPTDKGRIESKLKEQSALMFAGRQDKITFKVSLDRTSMDPQSTAHPNEDVIVEVYYPVRLVFPGTSFIFADPPKRLGRRELRATVRMPVERPLLN
ncbi:hypothetical protein Emin_1209 [Elusimicrobium minutum Pei191]|uniref:TadE-like domain-containing protein n=2 Tax=Elusimicrobium TaxID=423604 RepID=B2KE13_ELUMP|nr:hypothetical protein Emin_1209 [Elusimicrobium minutum Pei191]